MQKPTLTWNVCYEIKLSKIMLHFVGRTGHICFKNWIKFFVKKIILASCIRAFHIFCAEFYSFWHMHNSNLVKWLGTPKSQYLSNICLNEHCSWVFWFLIVYLDRILSDVMALYLTCGFERGYFNPLVKVSNFNVDWFCFNYNLEDPKLQE